MDHIALTEALRNPQEFYRRVKVARPYRTAAWTMLLIGALFFGANAASTLSFMGKYGLPSSLFWTVFWDTEGANAKSTIYLTVFTWGAPILLVGTIIAFVLDHFTKARVRAQAFARFQHSGHVALFAPIGMKVKNPSQNGRATSVSVLSAPGQDAQSFGQLAQFLAARVAQSTRSEKAQLSKQLRGRRGTVVISELWPDIPELNLVTRNPLGGNMVAVIPPAAAGKDPAVVRLKD